MPRLHGSHCAHRTNLKAKTLWTPGDLPGLVCYFDARDSSKITLNSGKISSWIDSSGRAQTFANGTAANQPNYNATGINGYPSAGGNGTSKYLLLNANLAGMSFAAGNYQFALYKPTASDTDQTTIIFGDNGGGGRNAFYILNQSTQFGGVGGVITWSSPTTGSALVHSAWVNGTGSQTSSMSINSATAQTATATRTTTAGTTYSMFVYYSAAPASNYLYGDIGIIGCGNGNLTTDDKNRMEGFMAWAYRIETALPSTHPYRNSPPYQ